MEDLLTEIPEVEELILSSEEEKTGKNVGDKVGWILHVDGASSSDGSGERVILTAPTGEKYTYALRFDFKCSNNESEYEALIAGLKIAKSMGVDNIDVYGDSMLIANKVRGSYEAKEAHIKKIPPDGPEAG